MNFVGGNVPLFYYGSLIYGNYRCCQTEMESIGVGIGALSAHNAFLFELLTLMGDSVRLNNCLYFAFKCKYK